MQSISIRVYTTIKYKYYIFYRQTSDKYMRKHKHTDTLIMISIVVYACASEHASIHIYTHNQTVMNETKMAKWKSCFIFSLYTFHVFCIKKTCWISLFVWKLHQTLLVWNDNSLSGGIIWIMGSSAVCFSIMCIEIVMPSVTPIGSILP